MRLPSIRHSECILLASPDHACSSTFWRNKKDPRLAFYDDLEGLLQQVVTGQGISFVSRKLVADEIQEGDLVTHEIEDLDLVRLRSLVPTPHFLIDDTTRDFLVVFFESLGLPIPEGVAG